MGAVDELHERQLQRMTNREFVEDVGVVVGQVCHDEIGISHQLNDLVRDDSRAGETVRSLG